MGYHDNPPYFLTAYDIAVKWGFRGTEKEWLDTLKAFYLAVQAGFTGTEEEWTELLVDPVPEFRIGEVITLDGGSMATASISGDKRKPVLNLGIPRGLGMDDALPLVGGTMKGNVNMNGFQIGGLPVPTENGHAVPKGYADKMLPLSGGTMTGALNVLAPTEKSHAVPKEYADKMLPLSGGTMTGVLNVLAPTESAHAANKEYVDSKKKSITVTLLADGWANKTQRVTAAGVGAPDKCDVIPAPAPDNHNTYYENVVRISVQEAGFLTFTCDDVPTVNLDVNILILN